jgi:catechol 2,3-dioxygenase-like lactoylglutathione lyase family enzyme
MPPPPLASVLETSLYVDDLERARAFYEGLMGLRRIFGDNRMTALDVGGQSALLLFLRGGSTGGAVTPGGTIPPHDGSGPLHFAFAITADALADWERHLGANGVAIEGRVTWPRGGTSVYFRDPDGHLVELATPGLWDIR